MSNWTFEIDFSTYSAPSNATSKKRPGGKSFDAVPALGAGPAVEGAGELGPVGQHQPVVAGTAVLGLGGMLVVSGQLTLGQLVAAEIVISTVAVGVGKDRADHLGDGDLVQ